MRSYEVAAVKMAIKRSIKAKNKDAGYNSIEKWFNKWKQKGIIVNKKEVIKCFNKWVKNKSR